MLIYGYTIVNSEGFWSGSETDTRLFLDKEERNESMYAAYDKFFYSLILSQDMEEDENGNEELTKEEFMEEIENVSFGYDSSAGLIQMSDYHVQFEPFTYEV